MRYVSNRERAIKFIRANVIPGVKHKDLDYERLVSYISLELKTSPKIIKSIFQDFINNKELALENGVLTIPDIDAWLKEQKEKREQIEKDLKENL